MDICVWISIDDWDRFLMRFFFSVNESQNNGFFKSEMRIARGSDNGYKFTLFVFYSGNMCVWMVK